MLYRSECNSNFIPRRLRGGARYAYRPALAALLFLLWGVAAAPARLWAQETPPPKTDTPLAKPDEKPQETPPPKTDTPSKPDEKPTEIAPDVLTAADKERIRRAGSLGNQMKVFVDVAQTYISAAREAAAQEQEGRLEEATAALAAVYQQAGTHIQRSPEKKKQKHLKKFEIALREQISLLKNLQSLVPYTLRDAFNAPIDAAVNVRKEAIHIIFEGGNVKKS